MCSSIADWTDSNGSSDDRAHCAAWTDSNLLAGPLADRLTAIACRGTGVTSAFTHRGGR
jgi:hypothetical protein